MGYPNQANQYAEIQGPEQGTVRADGTLDTGISDAGWAAITTITGGIVVSIIAPLIGLWVWQRKRILAKRLALENAESFLAEDDARITNERPTP